MIFKIKFYFTHEEYKNIGVVADDSHTALMKGLLELNSNEKKKTLGLTITGTEKEKL